MTGRAGPDEASLRLGIRPVCRVWPRAARVALLRMRRTNDVDSSSWRRAGTSARERPDLPATIERELWQLARPREQAHAAYREVQRRLDETDIEFDAPATAPRGLHVADCCSTPAGRSGVWSLERLLAALEAGQLDDVPDKRDLATLVRLFHDRNRLQDERTTAGAVTTAATAIHAARRAWTAIRRVTAARTAARARRPKAPRDIPAESARIRARIADLARQMVRLPNAPLPKAEALAALRATVRIAARWNEQHGSGRSCAVECRCAPAPSEPLPNVAGDKSAPESSPRENASFLAAISAPRSRRPTPPRSRRYLTTRPPSPRPNAWRGSRRSRVSDGTWR